MQRDIHRESQGRWKSILMGLGFAKHLSGKQCPCPICGGTDRFRFDDKEGRGTFICNRCGAGNGIDLVMKAKGENFTGACRLIRAQLPSTSFVAPKAPRDEGNAKAAMTRLWTQARPLDGRDAASRYLSSRGLNLSAYGRSLRVLDAVPYVEDGERGEYPCMLAKFVAPDNASAILHRTWLKCDGSGKAPVSKPRKMMPGIIHPGGAVRLSDAEATMGIAEGIETALAAEMIHGIPVWAALSAGNLMKWIPSAEAQCIVVFGDSDASFTGQMAAYSLAYKLRSLPDRNLAVEVAMPQWRDPGEAADWNDCLSQPRKAEAV